jgi:virginiamycin B lyase
MTISGVRPRLVALLTAIVVSVGLLSLSSLPAWAAAGTVTEFPVPSGSPFAITAGPDGALWFTEGTGNIGRITPAGVITAFRLLSRCGKYGDCEPYGITAGPDGNLWFTEVSGSKIGRITTN